MKPTHSIRLILVLLLASWSLLNANVTLKVNKDTIAPGEGVEVTLAAQGKEVTLPDIRAIGSYPVDTPSVSQKVQTTYINGSFSTLHEKVMRFTFFPDANVTIPAYTVTIGGKTEHTQPVTIHVLPKGTTTQHTGGYDLQMIVSKPSVTVGEPLVLQVIFFEPRNSEVAQAQYIAPKFDGFFVQASQQERLKQSAEGTAHIFDYILTPQKEGNLTITAAQIKLGIQTFSGQHDPWGFFNNEVHWQSLSAKPVTIAVKPLPVSADLVGDFTIQAHVDTLDAKPNKPINYTLTLQGKGGLEELDEPTFDIDGVTIYSDDAQSSMQIQNSQIVSKWVKKYTFIADHDFTIPALKLTTYDPKIGKTKILATQPYTVHIAGGTPAPALTKTAVKPSVAQPQASQPATTPSTTQIANAQPAQTPDTNRSILEDTAFYAQQAKKLRRQQARQNQHDAESQPCCCDLPTGRPNGTR
jgi:hypothetical protein